MISFLEINSFVLAVILIAFIQNVCDRHINIKEKAVIFCIWFFSFLPFVLIPIEISELITHQLHQDDDATTRHVLTILWKFYYWINFNNGWIIIPLWLGYHQSGFFTAKDKLMDSINFNVKFYLFSIAIILFAAIIILCSYEKKLSELISQSHVIYNSMSVNKFLHRISDFTQLWSLQISPPVYQLPKAGGRVWHSAFGLRRGRSKLPVLLKETGHLHNS